jgi:hypothetical protein
VNIIELKLELKKRIRRAKTDEEKQELRQQLADLEISQINSYESGKYLTGWIGQKKY